MGDTLYRTQKEIEGLKVQLSALYDLEKQQRAAKILVCESCEKGTRVSGLVYVQTHWYVSPSGCCEGDYWRQGEGQYVCPKCGHVNRSCSHKWNTGLKDFSQFSRSFKKTITTHGEVSDKHLARVSGVELEKERRDI